jgi:hypothetical protein
MAITRVQGNCRGLSTTNSIAITMTVAPTSGNMLKAVIGTISGSGYRSVSSISQTGVTWTRQLQGQCLNAYNTYQNGEIWEGVVGAGASANVTINLSGNAEYGAVANICEYSGLASSDLDKTAINMATGSATSGNTGTTDTTTQNDELWLGGMFALSSPCPTQNTPTNGFTLLDGAAGSQYLSGAFLEKIVSAIGTANSGTTFSGSANWFGLIATFKAAAGGTLQTVADSVGLSDSILRHKTLLPITDVLGLADAVLRNKTLTIADSVGASDVARSNKSPLIVADVVSLADLVEVITGAIIRTVLDVIGATDLVLVNKPVAIADSVNVLDAVFRHKPSVSILDVVSATEAVLTSKLLMVADVVSLADVAKVLKTLNVSDTLSLVDAVSTPSRVLRVLDAVGLADGAFVDKTLLISDNVSLVEVVEVGTGVKKTKLFLIIGDLAVQLTGE